VNRGSQVFAPEYSEHLFLPRLVVRIRAGIDYTRPGSGRQRLCAADMWHRLSGDA